MVQPFEGGSNDAYRTSEWASDHFIIKDARGQLRIVVNGQQPSDGVPVGSAADALWNLRRNGFANACNPTQQEPPKCPTLSREQCTDV